MCGIAGFHVKDPSVIKKHEAVELFADELLKGIEHRGKHATGFVSVGLDGKVVLDKAAKEATEFIKDRERIPEGVRTVLLHTRFHTLGSPENQENNHPVVYGSCFATHNGHINNHDELYTELDLTRNAEVDSSVIAAAANFHGIGDLDDIRSTLEALEGAMACAIINPVDNPGRLILARGSSSPLYVVDTPKFIVWSSTQTSIKEAWGKVLGTPPNEKKIERIEEGTFIVIDDGEMTREEFTVKKRPFGFGSYRPTQQTTGTQHGRNGRTPVSTMKPLGTLVERPVVVQAREAIQEYIKAGGTARHFDGQVNGLYDAEDDFKDVTGNNQWHPCYGCNRLILKQDLVKHAEWGTICIDCVSAVSRTVTEAENETQETLAGTTVPRIAPGDRDSLEVWADSELYIHREVIDELSKECGSYYSPQAIEFLVFFTTPEYRDVAGAAVNALITELREAYDICYLDTIAQRWEEVEGLSCEVPEEKPKPLLLEAGATDWRFCHEHNKAFKAAEGCEVCEREGELEGEARLAAMLDRGVEAEPKEETTTPSTEVAVYLPFERGRESVITHSARSHRRSSGGTQESEDGHAGTDEGGEIIELPVCGNCGTFVLRATESSCAVCERSTEDEGTNEGPFCVGCTSPDPNYVVGYAGKNYYYCSRCYRNCGQIVKEPDNTVSLCNTKSNHMRKDGVRVCHQHARRQSEILSDTTLLKRGATITEV